jgi:hypothetical protein
VETDVLFVRERGTASDLHVGAAKIERYIKAELFQVRLTAW